MSAIVSIKSFGKNCNIDARYDSLSQSDKEVYLALINFIKTPSIKYFYIKDSTTSSFDFETLNGEMLAKFDQNFVISLYDDLKIQTRNNIVLTRLNEMVKPDTSHLSGKDYELHKSFLMSFSRVGYSKNKQVAIVFLSYDCLAGNVGGSSILILEYFWNKWNVIHISNLTAY